MPDRMEDMVLISVDDHVVEPADMFDRHIPAKFKNRAPRIEKGSQGAHHWVVEGKRAPGLGLNAVMGRPPEEYGVEPVAYDQVRPGCFDVDARIGDMNADGVLGSLCFPSFPGFAGARLMDIDDKDLALATMQAYNDWHFYDWTGKYPGRFIPLSILPLWDIKLAVAEMERMAKLGVHAIVFPENPTLLGLPSLHDDYWHPLWGCCEANKVVLCPHIGSAGSAAHASVVSPIAAWITSMPISISNAAADWVFAEFWAKYPGLRIALSEGGIGWIPYLLERADFTQRHHGLWTRSTLSGKKPSEVFRDHFITCFIEDKFGLKNRDAIGVERITWECDYPHSDSVWPRSAELLWDQLKDLPSEEIDLISHGNAMREWSFDPFSVTPREQCTVGALREQARKDGVDTTPKSRGGMKPIGEMDRPVTTRDVVKVLSHV